MISIIEHIEYLIMRNDCVVIPEWGAFIAQHMPASCSEDAQLFQKPKRSVSFNASIIHNDGLLAHSIIRRHGLTFAGASKLIADHVALYKQLLNQGSEVPFGRLGYFVPIEHDGVEFVPFATEQSCDGYFGLKSYEFVPLGELEVAGEQGTVIADMPAPRRNWFSRRAIQTAASIAILLGLALALSTPIAMNTHDHQLATLNVPELKKQDPVSGSRKVVVPHADSAVTKKTISNSKIQIARPLHGNQSQIVVAPKEQPQAEAVAKPAADSGKYYLVICTLTSQKQVRSFFANEKRFKDAKVRKKGRQYRIYIDRGNDYGALMKKAQNLPQPYNQGWVTTD